MCARLLQEPILKIFFRLRIPLLQGRQYVRVKPGGIVQRPLVEPLHPAQDKFLPGLQGGLLHGGPTLAVLIEPAEIGASG